MGVVADIQNWVDRIVIGLDLCPFARAPFEQDRVRYIESRADSVSTILAELLHEIDLLDADAPEADTTLLIVPHILEDFDDFLDVIGAAEALLTESGHDGRYQLAHFHPDYVFADADTDDPANYTNRSPHPAIHILPWKQVRKAMETHPNVGRIPHRNTALLRGVGAEGMPSLTGPRHRDFRAELAAFKFWDHHTQAIFEKQGEALEDCILQNREEVIAFAEFIEANNIRSYLEIGVWTGGLVSALHSVFGFDQVAAADQGWAETKGFEIHLPEKACVFRGNSDSPEYKSWRANLGHVDLVLIDANHSYSAVKLDFEINRQYPHRFLAFHDITGSNRWTTGVRRFWEELNEGHKVEILRPHAELERDHSIMGIGVWSEVLP
jgi:hypothetical protein